MNIFQELFDEFPHIEAISVIIDREISDDDVISYRINEDIYINGKRWEEVVFKIDGNYVFNRLYSVFKDITGIENDQYSKQLQDWATRVAEDINASRESEEGDAFDRLGDIILKGIDIPNELARQLKKESSDVADDWFLAVFKRER